MTNLDAFLEEADREGKESENIQCAEKHIAEGRITTGRDLLRQIVSRSPSGYDRIHKSHDSVYIKYWSDEEVAWYRHNDYYRNCGKELVFLPGSYPYACYQLGCLHITLNEFDEAANVLQRGLSLIPDQFSLCLRMAQVFIEQGKLVDANEVLNRAINATCYSSDNEMSVCLAVKEHLSNAIARDKASRMENFFQIIEPIEWEGTLYRSMSAKAFPDIETLVGCTLLDRGFVSTTLSRTFAAGLNDVLVEIKVLPGTKVHVFSMDKALNEVSGEYEFVLNSGAKYKVVDFRRDESEKPILTVVYEPDESLFPSRLVKQQEAINGKG
jgi:tetratricopeptide (TPR) repeat protein